MSAASRILALACALSLAMAPLAPAQQPARQWEPRGFDFTRDGVWRAKARAVAGARAAALARGDFASLNAAMAATRGASLLAGNGPNSCHIALVVCGTLYEPIFLVDFKNTDPTTLHSPTEYTDSLLGTAAAPGRPFTVRTFYEQMSNNLLSIQGSVLGWITLDSNDTYYEGGTGCNALCGSSQIPKLMLQAVTAVDGTVDFGQFDNDGPDGIPNSGDDDGYVDLAVFIQPELDGACGPQSNQNIWSHRFSYAGWTGGQTIVTNDHSNKPGFGNIRINNYTIQSGVGGGTTSCDATKLMGIGTVAHETGHGFGLPDLYDTQPSDEDNSEGIGHWGLMSSGNYARPRSPSHMEGFSRMQLGWVNVVNLTTPGTYHLGPYTVGDTIFRITPTGANPRNEYWLLENRQATGGDTALLNTPGASGLGPKGPGLLIWHVDQVQYDNNLFTNLVNTGPIHGLAIEQADGLNQLGSSITNIRNRGDAGDPYPGSSGNTAFSAGTNPRAQMNTDHSFAGFAVDSIRQVVPNGEMAFRLRFGGETVVRASDSTALVRVHGVARTVFRDLASTGDTATISVDSIQASPDGRTHQVFTGWGDLQPRTHLVTFSQAGSTFIANLTRSFLVSWLTNGAGTATASAPATSGNFINEGDTLTLIATPGVGQAFNGWTGDTVTSQATLKFAVHRPYAVVANFLTVSDVVRQLLGTGSALDAATIQQLDQLGNRNGKFDLGDFLAWLDRTGVSVSAETMSVIMMRSPR